MKPNLRFFKQILRALQNCLRFTLGCEGDSAATVLNCFANEITISFEFKNKSAGENKKTANRPPKPSNPERTTRRMALTMCENSEVYSRLNYSRVRVREALFLLAPLARLLMFAGQRDFDEDSGMLFQKSSPIFHTPVWPVSPAPPRRPYALPGTYSTDHRFDGHTPPGRPFKTNAAVICC